jgi:hypothetical protein
MWECCYATAWEWQATNELGKASGLVPAKA